MKTLMENQLSWLTLFMTALYSLLASCRGEDCGHEELVRCARPLEKFSSNDLSFVTKKEELNRQCPDLEASLKCIQRFTTVCLQEKEKSAFGSLYTSTNMAIMELCQDGAYQEEFLRHASCMQKVKDEYEMCWRKYEKVSQEIELYNRTTEHDGPLKSVCCAFKEYLECSHHSVRRQCGEETARFSKDFQDRMSNALLKGHCTVFTEQECQMYSGSSTLNLSFYQSAVMPMTIILVMRYFT